MWNKINTWFINACKNDGHHTKRGMFVTHCCVLTHNHMTWQIDSDLAVRGMISGCKFCNSTKTRYHRDVGICFLSSVKSLLSSIKKKTWMNSDKMIMWQLSNSIKTDSVDWSPLPPYMEWYMWNYSVHHCVCASCSKFTKTDCKKWCRLSHL